LNRVALSQPPLLCGQQKDEPMTLADIAAALTGERMMTKRTGRGQERPSRDEIARLAYHFYEMRGRRGGQDVEDWLSAERELRLRYR
jgi:DUF2934 family protein